MEIEHYHITPDEVTGTFTIKRLSNFEDDDYAYLFVDMPGEGERCIVYNYPPEDGPTIRGLALPVSCFFEDGHLKPIEDTGPVLVRCPYCGGHHPKYTPDLCPLNPHRAL